jgi:hypothetical protein
MVRQTRPVNRAGYGALGALLSGRVQRGQIEAVFDPAPLDDQ